MTLSIEQDEPPDLRSIGRTVTDFEGEMFFSPIPGKAKAAGAIADVQHAVSEAGGKYFAHDAQPYRLGGFLELLKGL